MVNALPFKSGIKKCFIFSWLLATSLVLLLPPPTSSAQGRTPSVSVHQQGSDSVGQRLAFELREAIRRSAGYQLATDENADYKIDIIPIDPDKDKPSSGQWTVGSVAFSMSNRGPLTTHPHSLLPIYLSSQIVIAGKNQTDSQAISIVAYLDKLVDGYKKGFKLQ